MKKEYLNKRLKEYEKSAGYRVCYLCNKKIERGNRVVLQKEYWEIKGARRTIRMNAIGAVCFKCLIKLKDNYEEEINQAWKAMGGE